MAQEGSKNYYDLLGVLPSASMVELKRAFRDKAKSHHPDLNPDEAAQVRFRAIQEAYNILRDPVERTFYDRGLGLKSNWVEEAARDSERRRSTRVAGEARRQADEAEAGTSRRASSRTRSAGARATPGRGFEGSTTSRPPPGSTAGGASSAKAAASEGATEPSAGRSSASSSVNSEAGGPSASTGSTSRASAAGARTSPPGGEPRAHEPRTSRRSRFTSRFSGASSRSEAPRPSESYPPPPQPRARWYRDKPLRIFLFVANLLASAVFFFTDPQRGIYFLVLAFGVEGMYRLEDLKERTLRPPPFRPPNKG